MQEVRLRQARRHRETLRAVQGFCYFQSGTIYLHISFLRFSAPIVEHTPRSPSHRRYIREFCNRACLGPKVRPWSAGIQAKSCYAREELQETGRAWGFIASFFCNYFSPFFLQISEISRKSAKVYVKSDFFTFIFAFC